MPYLTYTHGTYQNTCTSAFLLWATGELLYVHYRVAAKTAGSYMYMYVCAPLFLTVNSMCYTYCPSDLQDLCFFRGSSGERGHFPTRGEFCPLLEFSLQSSVRTMFSSTLAPPTFLFSIFAPLPPLSKSSPSLYTHNTSLKKDVYNYNIIHVEMKKNNQCGMGRNSAFHCKWIRTMYVYIIHRKLLVIVECRNIKTV